MRLPWNMAVTALFAAVMGFSSTRQILGHSCLIEPCPQECHCALKKDPDPTFDPPIPACVGRALIAPAVFEDGCCGSEVMFDCDASIFCRILGATWDFLNNNCCQGGALEVSDEGSGWVEIPNFAVRTITFPTILIPCDDWGTTASWIIRCKGGGVLWSSNDVWLCEQCDLPTPEKD